MFIAYIEGLVAALTPCLLVLIPAYLYYFGVNTKQQTIDFKKLGFSIAGFLLFFVLVGMGLSQIIESIFANGFRLAVGVIFIYIGILQYKERINPLTLKGVNNPFLFGALFGLITSVSPCVLPASVLLIAGNSAVASIFNFITFGLGILTPSIVVAFTGNKLTEKVKSLHKYSKQINIASAIILILSGSIMLYNLMGLTKYDVLVSSVMLLLLNLLIVRLVLFVHKKHSMGTYLMLLSLFIFLGASIFHCYSIVPQFAIQSCATHEVCKVCQTCSKIFGVGVIFSAIGYLQATSTKKRRKIQFK